MDIEKAKHNRPSGFHSRWIVACISGLGVISCAVYLFNFRLSNLVPDFSRKTDIHVYILMFVFLSVLYFLGLFLILKNKSEIGNSRGLLTVVLLFAVLFRLCLIPRAPEVLSNDMYRYIWDGRVQQSGINPYRYPPAAEALKALQDNRIFPNINRKDSPTIYPAGAQVFFRLFYRLVGDSVTGYKCLMVFFDLLTLLALTALLRVHGFETARLMIYAWNPLVIFEIAYSGHLEGITVFFMVAALYLNAIQKETPGTIMLAISSAVKLYPALLLPVMLNRGHRVKGVAAFFSTFLLLYMPYVSAGSKMPGFLSDYLKNPYESFNLGLKYLLMHLFTGLEYYLLTQMFIIVLLAVGFAIFLKNKQGIQAVRYAFILVGLLIVMMPASLHPWYVIMIIPFLAFYPNTAWLIFTCAVTLSYLKYVADQGIMPTWVLLVEYMPLFGLLATGFLFNTWSVRKGANDTFSTANIES